MEPGHFQTCRLWDDISLTELLSSLSLFDESGCNELLPKTTSVSREIQRTGFSSAYVCIIDCIQFENFLWNWDIFLTVLQPHKKQVRKTLPESFKTIKTLSYFSDWILPSISFMTKCVLKTTFCPILMMVSYLQERCFLL